jgi:LPS-assembly protein
MRLVWMLVLLAVAGIFPAAARAQHLAQQMQVAGPEFKSDQPVAMEADEVGYDQPNGIVIARGHVVVAQDQTVINADEIVYYQQRDVVEAQGNVSMLQPSGDVYFGEHVELTDDMKRGVIKEFRGRLSDDSVFAAREAVKVNPALTTLSQAVYTPCHLCANGPPFWQLKAKKVSLNELDERVYYRDARLEMKGVPVLYTPYFSHPTPDAEARSGFLTPQYSQSGNFGTVLQVPYYWRINHSSQVTLTPWYLSEEGWLLEEDYRQLTDGGNYRVRGSLTDARNRDVRGRVIPGRELRGHIYAQGEEDVTDWSRVGFDIERSTDDTYLRRYGFGNQRVLFSRAYYEAAQDRNYMLAQGLAIQGLTRNDDPSRTPLVLPTIEGYYETDPYDSGLRFHFFGDAQSLTRQLGADQRRLVLVSGASLPYVSDGGHLFTATVNLRQDLYSVNDVLQASGSDFSGSKARTVPQAALEWRLPLIRQAGNDVMTIEPIVLAVAQPFGGNPPEIDNEDNLLIELNDTNLFSLNRMPGLDTVDSGPRLAYGGRGQYLFAGGEGIEALFGQNYNVDSDTPFPNSTQQGKHFSDYIGNIGFDYQPLQFTYGFAFNNENFRPDRTEFTGSFTQPWLSLSASYRELRNNQYIPDSREIIFNGSLPLTDEWTFYGGARRDLKLDRMIAANSGLLYRNECFNLMLQAQRVYTRDRDIEPTTDFTFRVGFKNLGEFGGH